MVRTFRGREIDMNKLAKEYETSVALGNMKVNARGDKIENGQVVKTREEILAETKPSVATTVGTVSMRDNTSLDDVVEPDIEEVKAVQPKRQSKKEVKEVETVSEEKAE